MAGPLLARRPWAIAFLLYLGFVVYGSLVPLEWRAVPLDQAIAQFRHIRMLVLGAGSRADWVANIVLYVPLAFFGCAALVGFRSRGPISVLGPPVVLAGCLALAVAVEFTQIFFAPRTVSLNDLIAEAVGAGIGTLAWVLGRWRVVWIAAGFARGGPAAVTAALATLAGAYVLLSLFPYDFVVSSAELGDRLRSSADGWLLGTCDRVLRCLAVAAGEALVIAPIGLLLTIRRPRLPLWRLFVLGAGIGVGLELLQLLLVSGVSRGLSVPLRGLGLAAGGVLARLLLFRLGPADLARRLWPWLGLLALPYAAALAGLSGWFSGTWGGPGAALARLPSLDWVPFFYHYWTSEAIAVTSLLAQLALYFPIGVGFWVRAAAFPARRVSGWPVVLTAVLVALVIETGKLFVAGQRPDPSNLFIAPWGALAGFWGAVWFERVIRQAADCDLVVTPAHAGLADLTAPARSRDRANGRRSATSASPGPSASAPDPVSPAARLPRAAALLRLPRGFAPLPARSPVRSLLATLAAAVALVAVFLYPLGLPLLLGLLAAYALALWFQPWLVLVVLPVALPGLDASPLTGRLLCSEFDLLVLVTLAVLGVRLSGVRPARWPVLSLAFAVGLLWLAWLIGTWRGLGGFETLGALPRAASHTPLDAWHVGKGLLWALLLVGPLRRLRRWLGSALASRLLLDGVVLGLAWTVLVVLWERHIHVGLFDLTNEFRVTGPFASMHTGGAYIEAYLAFALPVLLLWMVQRNGLWLRIAGAVLALSAGYAMLVTFSRAGYGALLVALLVVGLGLGFGRRPRRGWRSWALPGGVVLLLALLAVPALTTGFARERLALVEQDLNSRLRHWAAAVHLLADDPTAMVFGAGLGRYPSLYLMNAAPGRPPGTFQVLEENGNWFLRLGRGELLYLDQRVHAQPDATYRLSARLRGADAGALALSTSLCQKALLYSFTCVFNGLAAQAKGADWVEVSAEVAAGAVGRSGHWPYGPVTFSLFNMSTGVLDVDEVRLTDSTGRNLLANGGFSQGAERWLFVTDQDPAWHIHQQWVEMFVAQGAFGLLAFLVLLLAVARVLWAATRAGRLEGLALAAGLAGFLAVGLLGSTMDAARPMLVFYFGALSAALLVKGPDLKPRRRRRPAPPTRP